MPDEKTLILLAGMTLVTLLPRLLPVLLLARRMPRLLERWLSLIAPAILAALVLPELLLNRETSPATFVPWDSPYLWAALPTFLVAWKSKSLFGTVIVGIGTVALLRLCNAGL